MVHNDQNKTTEKWVRSLSQRLKKAYNIYYKTKGIKFHKRININWIDIVLKLGPCPGNPRRWNIDHIVPASFFCLEKEQIKICWSIENLTWLPRFVNTEKDNKYPWSYKDITKTTYKRLNKDEIEYIKNNDYKYIESYKIFRKIKHEKQETKTA